MAFSFIKDLQVPTETEGNRVSRIILAREVHHDIQVGPCGMSRFDIIYFQGVTPSEEAFELRLEKLKSSTDRRDKDIYMIEFLWADTGAPTTERGGGDFVFKAEKVNGEWVRIR